MSKTLVISTISINAYKVISRAVEEGVEYGWNRAHKHSDKPTPDAIKYAIEDALMNELCDLLVFGDDDE